MLKIESGAHGHRLHPEPREELKQTLLRMKVGQSVFVPVAFLESVPIYSVISRLRVKNGLHFTTLREINKSRVGRRIWRKAEPKPKGPSHA